MAEIPSRQSTFLVSCGEAKSDFVLVARIGKQGIRKDVQDCLRHEEWEQDVHQIVLELPQDVKAIQGHILNIVQSTLLEVFEGEFCRWQLYFRLKMIEISMSLAITS